MSGTVRLPFCPTAADVVAPEGWHISKIVDSYEQLPSGQRYDSKSVDIDGDVPVLDQSQAGVLGFHSDEPGVVASVDAPVVTFANHTCAMRVLTTPFSVIQNVFPLIGRPGICDSRFLYYATNGRQSTEEYKGHHPAWRNSYFAYPDLEIQRRIVEILQPFDDLIENNRRRIEVLEEMARAIYREWFVKFRYPGHEDVPLVDSALGPIPEGWRMGTIGDALELKYGKALKADARRGGDVAVVSSAGIVGWHDESVVAGPAIVVGRKGNVGSVHWVDGPCWPIDTAYFVRTDLPLRFVAEQLRRTEFSNSHAAVPGLSREAAYARPFLIPPTTLLDSFQELVDPFGAQVATLSSQGEKLGQLRDLLLPKLVTGQIDVSSFDLDALVFTSSTGEGAVA